MRGEIEQKCLDYIKYNLFYKNSTPIINPLTKRSFSNAEDSEFIKNIFSYCNRDFRKCFFGLLKEDISEFINIIRKAKPNPENSLFPDFIFDNGFIEHFQITSSKTNRKGAVHKKKENEFKNMVESETEKIIQEWNKTSSFDTVRSKSFSFTNPEHSYDFLGKSFKNSWEHHLKSCNKYTGSKEIGIFMVEYPEIALCMYENVYHSWIDGMSQGDMREQEEFKEYRLSRDKNLLKYIYNFRHDIKYVIFLNQVRIEIICTENIPYLIKLLPWDYIVYPNCVTTLSSIYSSNVQIPSKQGNKINDEH